MQFSYKSYRPEGALDLKRPVIEIVLRNPRNESAAVIGYEALVDSGSDRNIFPAELAELIGIDLTDTESIRQIGGVVAGERRRVYFHQVEMELGGPGGPRFITSIGFMTDFSDIGYGLLGRRGFFDRFSFIKFKDFDSLLEVGKLRGP
jgi:hypothetical protein